ncbi:hypothetical protein LTR04_002412 [Oleoguttula sp. CCFEE 6159]|nr:hypothetical protein LTR04_002412 [Oleoguttula sp. CCFEE 6159]
MPRSASSPSLLLPASPPGYRSLPSRHVSDENIDEAYAAFIFYCNPSFPTSLDPAELKRAFRAPPKSDGHAYSTFHLFELVSKLDSKEIKTWSQLALDLGVERPSDGQSTQKRWMRAMHIDAFFEYLLGKEHAYFIHLPPVEAPHPEGGRDGVPLEEDLAIRALDPSFRPKRGRRRAEDQDEDSIVSLPVAKRPRIDTSLTFGTSAFFNQPQSAYPTSAYPMSAQPDEYHDPWTSLSAMPQASVSPNTGRTLTPHSAISTTGPIHLRWRLNPPDGTPSTPHPLSAFSSRPPENSIDESQSAITPSRHRSRRRHGPAVSSAWFSAANSPTGKLRGRPPSNRSVQDGPYVTFPANPKPRDGPASTPVVTPVTERVGETPSFRSLVPSMPSTMQPPASQSRPVGLQLQVPQHMGGTVRLVTPTLLVNGESDPPSQHSPPRRASLNTGQTPVTVNSYDLFTFPQTQQSLNKQSVPLLTAEHLKRTLAADLLRADITGRTRLRGTEAKELADAILLRIRPRSVEHVHNAPLEDTFLLVCASWLGVPAQLSLGLGSELVGSVKRIVVHRYRIANDGCRMPLEDDSEDSLVDSATTAITETYDISWSLLLGGLSGSFQLKGLVIPSTDSSLQDDDDDGTVGDARTGAPVTTAEWRRRTASLEEKLKAKDLELQTLKDSVMNAVL